MRLRRVSLAITLALAAACSTSSKRPEEFSDRAGDEKLYFMAYFPYLTDPERERFLQSEMLDYDTLSELPPDDGAPPAKLPKLTDIPKSATIRYLRIEALPSSKGFALGAYARWEGAAEEIDITRWVKWKSFSEFARVENPRRNELVVGCGTGTVSIEADFMGYARKEERIAVDKSVQRILVELDARTDDLSNTHRQKARAVAYCSDGTQSDVSCGADWSMASGNARVFACGKLEVNDRPGDAPVRVRASYGGKTSLTELFFSRRP